MTTQQQQASSSTKKLVIRRRQVQIVHRHGDRSPITSLKDETYWQGELVAQDRLDAVTRGVAVLSDGVGLSHKAGGRGPFGKLTTLGLQQMQELGETLRNEFFNIEAGNDSATNESKLDVNGNRVYPFLAAAPTLSNVRIISTSFERAIQSAQGVLAGLFPNGWQDGTTMEIDARHTVRLLPDPQPRETREQLQLEDDLAARPHLQAREQELLPLAVKVTAALHPLLAADAHEAVFGAKQLRQKQPASAESIEIEPLAWNQLAEITKCLACRDKLPAAITQQDHFDVVQHAAWRWFESFRHPRLAYLGMYEQCLAMVNTFRNSNANDNVTEPLMTLYSAHDSTLIGLLCAFKLERPVAWPEYGSFLTMELLEVSEEKKAGVGKKTPGDLYVRFTLNGERLRTMWDDGEPAEMILLDRLAQKLSNEGKATEGLTQLAFEYRYVPKS